MRRHPLAIHAHLSRSTNVFLLVGESGLEFFRGPVCQRTKKIVIELEYFSNWQSSNGRARRTIDHPAAANLSLPSSPSFSLCLSLQISWPTAKNQSARFFPPASSCLFHDDCRFHPLPIRFGKIRRPSIRREMSRLCRIAISALRLSLDNEFPRTDPRIRVCLVAFVLVFYGRPN